MKRLLIDVSSIAKTGLYQGEDREYGRKVEHDGKLVHVNGWQHGFERFTGYVTSILQQYNLQPHQVILVLEGMNSKARRTALYPLYKGNRKESAPEYNEQFNILKNEVCTSFRNVGATIVSQDGVEADDVLAYLAQTLKGEVLILSNDGDMAALMNGRVGLIKDGVLLQDNPLGPFPVKYITLYKSIVGDSSDNIKGAFKFGEKAWLDLLVWAGEPGLAALEGMVKRRTLHELAEDVAEFKPLQRIIDSAKDVYDCYDVALLHPEWIDTLRQPLQWKPGMVQGRDVVTDERLRQYAAAVRIVTADNYASALSFFASKMPETPFVTLDLETTVTEDSDFWLQDRSTKGGGVDVIGSRIVGCGLTFGANDQYGFYCSVEHKDTNNITLDQLRELLDLIPQSRITVAHNAAGFELPVLYNAFGEDWKDNGWRGMYPNMVDSRIAATYWDENQFSHGLKQMSSLLLDYQQVSYDQVTTKYDAEGQPYRVKMDGLTAEETVSYGLDDVFTTTGIFNFFTLIMELEDTLDAYYRIEQKPMYLSALSYAQGTSIDLARLRDLAKADEVSYAKAQTVVNAYLIEKGWEGTQCPYYTELDAKGVKQIVNIVLGLELDTQVRTVSKLAVLVDLLEHEDAPLLSAYIATNNLAQINDWVQRRFDGTPDLNVGSNKQLTALLYDTMGLPVRLRNKATDAMRSKGIREGNPRADEDAMMMAIKMGDAQGQVADVLQALNTMKSINTRRGLYWEPYPKLMHWKTGKLHPELKQCGTNTRRHTSSNPNIQQLDSTTGGVRSVILPHHKDAVIVSLDLAGQELRLLADYSKDENMLSAYIGDNLKDLHSMTASMILDVPYEEFRTRLKSDDKVVASEANNARQAGKVTGFSVLYGATAGKVAETLGVTQETGQKYVDALDRAFPRVPQWKKETEALASTKGWVPILGGTRRHLRGAILSPNSYEASKAMRQASNSRIQGAGGNQIRLIMGYLWDSGLLEQYDLRFYFPLHDEMVLSVGRKDAVPAIQAVHGLMCSQFLDQVPSASSVGIGPNYGDLVEIGEVADEEKIVSAVGSCFKLEPAKV